jgi:hypothetical protein
MNRITINSEHDIVNVRLLSICPPAALRPYFQEGYLAGTADVTTSFETKTTLDFRNRLIAKFAIPRAQSDFWGSGFGSIPETALFPKRDSVRELCMELKLELKQELRVGDIGSFIKAWVTIEEFLLENARRLTERNVSVPEAIDALAQRRVISPTVASELQALRNFRNQLVHKQDGVQGTTLVEWLNRIRSLMRRLPKREIQGQRRKSYDLV